jgi:RNA polymerase sigma-70 factor (ECF subfamily)
VLAAYDNFHRLRQEKAFLSYLFSIASRIYYAEIKRSRRENGDKFQALGGGQDVAVMFQSEISPEDRADINILYNVMDRLDDRQREALILADLMGFSHKEVADIQGSTVAAVKVRIHRAKKRLGKMLSDSGKWQVVSCKEESSQFSVLSSKKNNKNGNLTPFPLSKGEGEDGKQRISSIENPKSSIEYPESNIEHQNNLTPCPLSKGEGKDGQKRTTNNEQRRTNKEEYKLVTTGSERSFYERN